MRKALLIAISMVLLISCSENVTRYIFPYAEFAVEDDGNASVTLTKHIDDLSTLPDKVEIDGKTYALSVFAGYKTEDAGKEAKTLIIPSSFKSIKSDAFKYATNLEELTIEGNVDLSRVEGLDSVSITVNGEAYDSDYVTITFGVELPDYVNPDDIGDEIVFTVVPVDTSLEKPDPITIVKTDDGQAFTRQSAKLLKGKYNITATYKYGNPSKDVPIVNNGVSISSSGRITIEIWIGFSLNGRRFAVNNINALPYVFEKASSYSSRGNGVPYTVRLGSTTNNATLDSKAIDIPAEADVVLNLNGNTITLKNSSIDNTGSFTIEGSGDLILDNSQIANNGDLTVKGGTISSSTGNIIEAEAGTVTVDGGTLESTGFPAINITSGKLSVKSGAIISTGSSAINIAGADSDITISGGSLTATDGGNNIDAIGGEEPNNAVVISGFSSITSTDGASGFAGGNGKKSYPYLLTKDSELSSIVNYTTENEPKYFCLSADIEVEYSTRITRFIGYLNGANHTITVVGNAPSSSEDAYKTLFLGAGGSMSNFTYKTQGAKALIYYAYRNLTLENITIESASGDGTLNVDVTTFAPLLYTTQNSKITIKNCINNANIKFPEHSGSVSEYRGSAFVGCLSKQTYRELTELTFENCTNNGNIANADKSAALLAVAEKTYKYSIESSDCTNNGTLSGTTGGITSGVAELNTSISN